MGRLTVVVEGEGAARVAPGGPFDTLTLEGSELVGVRDGERHVVAALDLESETWFAPGRVGDACVVHVTADVDPEASRPLLAALVRDGALAYAVDVCGLDLELQLLCELQELLDDAASQRGEQATTYTVEQLRGLASLLRDCKGAMVTCRFCEQAVPAATAHAHGGQWVGDECCWDERLRASE